MKINNKHQVILMSTKIDKVYEGNRDLTISLVKCGYKGLNGDLVAYYQVTYKLGRCHEKNSHLPFTKLEDAIAHYTKEVSEWATTKLKPMKQFGVDPKTGGLTSMFYNREREE